MNTILKLCFGGRLHIEIETNIDIFSTLNFDKIFVLFVIYSDITKRKSISHVV